MLEESTARMKLSSKVNEQEQLINALSSELMKFEQNQAKMQQQIQALNERLTGNTDEGYVVFIFQKILSETLKMHFIIIYYKV